MGKVELEQPETRGPAASEAPRAPADARPVAARAPEARAAEGTGGSPDSGSPARAAGLGGLLRSLGASRRGLPVAVALGLILALAAFALDWISSAASPEAKPSAISEPAVEVVDPMGADELEKIAAAALAEGDLATAERALEDALLPLGQGEIARRIGIYDQLADLKERRGDENLGRWYRRYAARLRADLGGAVEVFGRAEDALREGDLDGARRLYHAFLLRSAEIDDRARPYIRQARRRIAEIGERKLAALHPGNVVPATAPEVFFDAR